MIKKLTGGAVAAVAALLVAFMAYEWRRPWVGNLGAGPVKPAGSPTKW